MVQNQTTFDKINPLPNGDLSPINATLSQGGVLVCKGKRF